MKRVTLKSEARLNGLDSDIAESTLATIAARLGEISLAASDEPVKTDLNISSVREPKSDGEPRKPAKVAP